ncbi:hypothetical protein Pfo_031540, partial [Paulownia fortunei]
QKRLKIRILIMAIGMNDLKTGLTIEYSNSIWRGGAFVRSKLKNLRTGAVNEVTFRPGDKFEQADITTRPMSYLYAENDGRVFMDFLLEGMEVKITMYGNEILGAELPSTVQLKVLKHNRASRTGATITVPDFVNEGETIIVNTEDGSYKGRA